MSGTAVHLEGGGAGEAIAFEGEVLDVVVDRPLAPGTPVALRLAGEGLGIDLRGKTIGSKRTADGRYAARLRLVDLTRRARDLLAASLARPTSR
jgi:hypothetical protein